MCAGCSSLKSIWKSHGKDKYCKECWYKSNPPTTTPKQRTPVKKISDKRKKEMSVYDKRRLAFLALNKWCQANLPGCTGISSDVHHMEGRIGDNYLNISKWKALCRNCHKFVEENPEKAKELGLSKSRLNIETNE